MRPPLQLIEDAFRLITNNLFIYVTYAIVMTVLSVLPIFIYGMNVSAPDFSINMSYGPGYLVITLLSVLY